MKVLKDEFSNQDLAKELENEVSVLTYGSRFFLLSSSTLVKIEVDSFLAVACGILTVCCSLDTLARLSFRLSQVRTLSLSLSLSFC